ncbi:hypothetical protein KR222_005579 [Zaprionus bogoriensis]|nr:hypothetical protein KR222_005579 [Zaprionus bogoriensis]
MSISGTMLWIYIAAGVLLIHSCRLAAASATANAGYVDHGDTKVFMKRRVHHSTLKKLPLS